jgi:GNAT superfamily N-acetyltransferase
VDAGDETRSLSGEPTFLPIAVRRARNDDRGAVLAFASETFGGEDYIAEVWDDWLEADDGVCLVAVAQATADGPEPIDSDGRPIEADRPIAFSRVALLSSSEAWLEGIRVDPAVRGRSVATALQVAELTWAGAQGASLVRYVTGDDNEASHRLGARHGFHRLADRRTWGGARRRDALKADPAARASDTERLAGAGLALPADLDAALIGRWWSAVEADALFQAGDRLYEWRPWTFQELTLDRLAAHVRAGRVVARGDAPAGAGSAASAAGPWALGVLGPGVYADDPAHLGLLVGEPAEALALAVDIREALGQPVRVRLPDPAPAFEGLERRARTLRFTPHRHTVHVLGRDLTDLPSAEPGQLTYVDEPRPTARPSHLG